MAKLWIVSLRRFYGEHFKAPRYVSKVRNFKGDPFGYTEVGSLCGLKMVKGHPIFLYRIDRTFFVKKSGLNSRTLEKFSFDILGSMSKETYRKIGLRCEKMS
jgi:hypothetical protein